MATHFVDENGTKITSKLKMVFVCDMCENTADFYHGMTTYTGMNGDQMMNVSFCSEICARKAVA